MKVCVLLSWATASFAYQPRGNSPIYIEGRWCTIKHNAGHVAWGDKEAYTAHDSLGGCIKACAKDADCVTAEYCKNNGYW